METYSKDTTLRDYLRVIFKHKYLVIITIIPVVVINYVILEFKTPVYDANVKMLVAGQKIAESSYYKLTGKLGVSANHAALINSRQVITPVVLALKLYEVPDDYESRFASPLKRWWMKNIKKRMEALKKKTNNLRTLTEQQERDMRINNAIIALSGQVSVEPVEESDLFLIKAIDFDPVVAAIITNSVSRSYIIFDLQQQLAEFKLKYGEKHASVVQLNNYIEEMTKTLDGKPLPGLDLLWPASIKVVEQAEVSEEPTESINKTGTLVISFLGGLMLGVVLSFVIGLFDQRFQSPLDLETFLKVPLLGSIPKVRKRNQLLIEETNQPANYTKAFHNLADQLYLLIKDKQLKSILITDMKSSKKIPVIAANLAAYIGKKADNKVLIIDANLRNSASIQTLNIPNTHGLGEILEEKLNLEDVICDIGSNISILPSGNPNLNPLNLIASKNMQEVINRVKDAYEIVFIICAGLGDYQDAVVLSSITDSVILIVDEQKDRRQAVKFAISPVEQKKANILGVILNNRSYVIPEIIYKLT